MLLSLSISTRADGPAELLHSPTSTSVRRLSNGQRSAAASFFKSYRLKVEGFKLENLHPATCTLQLSPFNLQRA
jgi:hypothetical protein